MEFVLRWRKRHEFAAEYFQELERQQKLVEKQKWAVSVIIREWRRYRERQEFLRLKQGAQTIKRVFKGHVARKRFQTMRASRGSTTPRMPPVKAALKIQAVWRGYCVRKHVFDFYERKKFLQEIQKAGEKTRKELNEFLTALNSEQEPVQVAMVITSTKRTLKRSNRK